MEFTGFIRFAGAVERRWEVAKSTMPDSNNTSPLPSLKKCLEAVEVENASGVGVVGRLSDTLAASSPELAEIMASSSVTTRLQTYELQDRESFAQQTALKDEATWANLCLLAAGVASALVLAVSAFWPLKEGQQGSWTDFASLAKLVIGVVTLGLGAAAAYFNYVARDQNRIARWQAKRGEAELARLDVFSMVAEKAAAAGTVPALYGLAVVVRHLVKDQGDWLVARAKKHRDSSETTSRWGGFASALAFIGGSGAIIASQLSGTVWIVLAGVAGAAIGAFASNREALMRDRPNADRYENTQVALAVVAGRTDEVEKKIAGGEPAALVAFTSAVTELLGTEHKQWLEGAAQAGASLQKLDEDLAKLGQPPQQ